jgi:LEA14-like dessication related protein
MASYARAVLLVFALLAVSCSRPQPPTLAPQRAEVTSIGTAGLSLLVQMAAYNPNRFGLSVRSVTATVTLDGRLKLGEVTVNKAIDLPAGQWTRIDVPLSIAWTDLPSIVALAVTGRTVAYTVDGRVDIGGDVIHVDLPFHLAGEIKPEQLAALAIRMLPKLPVPSPR